MKTDKDIIKEQKVIISNLKELYKNLAESVNNNIIKNHTLNKPFLLKNQNND